MRVGTIDDVAGSPYELVFQELSGFVYADAVHCPSCSRVEQQAVPVAVDLPDPTFDVSVTLDGAVVATDAFRAVCVEVPGVAFSPLDGADGCWVVEVETTVRIEPFDSHVRTGVLCTTCGRPRYVTRSGPLHLESGEILPEGFSCTDLEFGDTADFGPSQPVRLRSHLLIDRPTQRMLKSSDLSGIHVIAHP